MLPAPGPADVLVRTTFSGISRGTERLVFEGRVPAEQAEDMRGPNQAGAFPWPVKYGYCAVGVVEAGALPAGTRVFCLHPHQDRFVVPAASVVPLPDDVPSGRAVLAANLETAINACWDAEIGPGDRVAIVGCGVVGALVGRICGRIPGTEVTVIDVRTDREPVARALGIGFATPDRAPVDCDRVFHASASSAGLATALSCAGTEAMIVELSWYGDRRVEAPLGGAFHHRRITLRSSQVGQLPPSRRPRWTYRRRMELALKLLADPVLDLLVDGESAFADLPDVMDAVTGETGGLCHRIRYPESTV